MKKRAAGGRRSKKKRTAGGNEERDRKEDFMTGIIDYDAGNLRSVEQALAALGEETVITRDPERLFGSDRVIFPGVGAFRDCKEKLDSFGLSNVVKELARTGKPLLGICIGMQLMFGASTEGTEETGDAPYEGLGLFPGLVKKFPEKEGFKIPHMGWNSISIRKNDSPLFEGIPDGSFFYFVHSYAREAEGLPDLSADTEYSMRFAAAAERGRLFGVQFHPEKSSDAGLKLLSNFLRLKD